MIEPLDLLDGVHDLVDRGRRACRHGLAIGIATELASFRCDHPGGIRVVRTVFGPYCTLDDLAPGDPGPEGHWRIASAEVPGLDAAMDDVVRAAGRAGVEPVAVRRWAGDFVHDRYDLGAGRSVVVHREPFTGLTVCLAAERELWYLRPGPDFDVPHTEHALKYPLRVTLRQAGFGQAHAAACRFAGMGLLLMGHRRAGKSTLLMHLLRAGARFVANDLSYVRRVGDGCEMIAFPHMTRIGLETVADNDVLRAFFAAEERTGDYLRSAVFNGGKEEFYFPVLERMWGPDPVVRVSSLDAVVFPSLDPSLAESTASRLDDEEVARRVRDALVDDSPLPDWLPVLGEQELRALATAAAADVASCRPAGYELRYGPSATDPVAALAAAMAVGSTPAP